MEIVPRTGTRASRPPWVGGRPARNLLLVMVTCVAAFASDAPRTPMPVRFEDSAEYRWLNKKVLDSRLLDDMSDAKTWVFEGQGRIAFPAESEPGEARVPGLRPVRAPAKPEAWCPERHLRVDVNIQDQRPAAGRSSGLPAVALKRAFPGEDWSGYNRLSFWMRADLSGFNILPILVVMRNDGKEKVPDVYRREGNHYLTLGNHQWTRVTWEITPLARDKVTSVEFHYWVNKRIADPANRVAFEIGRLELERVVPDHFEGWNVAPGAISFSHTGYPAGASKSAVSSGLEARQFTLLRADDGQFVLRKPVRRVKTRLGDFEELDFSEVRTPGTYLLQAGNVRTRPFRIDPDVWKETIWKSINFFYGERCGFAIPGIHDVCHRDWQAVLGDQRIIMNGGWHDAGDLSQGLVNTGEATYAMFALAERMQARGEDPQLLARLLDEAKWGLAWVLRVRFDGGYRIGFAGNNIWTNGIVGDADDRSRAAQNNPNVNFIAAAAEAIAFSVLKRGDPELAARSLRTAEDDWRCAIATKETPENLSTPAFAASDMELASIGILASLELFRATGRQQYAEKAQELARIVVDSQQRTYIGSQPPTRGLLLHRSGEEGYLPPVSPGQRPSAHRGPGASVRDVPRAQGLDEMVFGGRALFRVSEEDRGHHRAVRRAAGLRVQGRRVPASARERSLPVEPRSVPPAGTSRHGHGRRILPEGLPGVVCAAG